GAFAAYQAANRDSRASALPAVVRYDRAAQERVTEQLIAAPVRTLPGRAPSGAPGPRPIFVCGMFRSGSTLAEQLIAGHPGVAAGGELELLPADRKSTRLNSSHVEISYAVFCLKKK